MPCSIPVQGQAFVFEIKFLHAHKVFNFVTRTRHPLSCHTLLWQARTVFLAAADDRTRERCVRMIQAASADIISSSIPDLASTVILSRDLLAMKSIAAIKAGLAALGVDVSEQCLKLVKFPFSSLKHFGFDLRQLISEGFDAATMKHAGFTAAEMTAAKFDLPLLVAGGYSVKELRSAGFAALQLKGAGCSAQQMKDGGIPIADMIELHGLDCAKLVKLGYQRAVIEEAGFSFDDIICAGLSQFAVVSLPSDVHPLLSHTRKSHTHAYITSVAQLHAHLCILHCS